MSSKFKNLTQGSFWRVMMFATTAFTGFIMMPFVIHSLGDRMYGLWTVVGTFLGYYGLLDLGLSSAIPRFIARAVGLKNNDEINITVNTFFFLFLFVGLAAFTVTLLGAAFVHLIIKDVSDISLLRKVLLILGLNSAMTFPMFAFAGLLEAHLRYDISGKVEIVKTIVRTVLVFVVLKMGHGILALAVINLTVNIFSQSVFFMICRRLNSELVISFKLVDLTRIKAYFNYSIITFVSQIADKLRFNVDNFIIAGFLGLSSVTLYAVPSRLMGYFRGFSANAFGVFIPLFSQYEGAGDYQSIREKLLMTTKISSYISVFLGFSIAIFGEAFLERWVGDRFLSVYPILILFTITVTIDTMQYPMGGLLYGISKHKIIAICNSVEGIVNLTLSIIFVKKFGLMGVAMGTAIPLLITKLFIYPVYTCRVLGLPVRDYLWDILATVFLKSSLIMAAVWFLIRHFLAPSYLSLVLLGSVALAVFTAFVYFFGLNEKERNYFKRIQR